ncbi:uncharacterized protein LOC122281114 [Carya illinoinensis]|uniref:5'-3' DNA helicase ZGRF1-like N-terminal domain-containing protein n=1 Tax=Carya illinoinensis TaxID=32201 RepID=A0A8T1P414_CARIL|nr:uncharacterized protein LOC122281114 [Carya illinoinensis]KAG6636533.1 hypothetical protein CIPAW_11G117200 [Carya illinoinensis]KAG6636534.1 hypothetical protein CIPAW_11G117200 [Carya illinoinensis]KAG6636535.1 hypothetical protein CIPAW_11G117200 [Carya illinoinensis]KAG6636536.1 hypothetical protein CIPAW_11G117200 [Carya illinoinensis]
MADVKRWTVTYTKQLTQKRKVYQDGFLELQTSTDKVMLYDDYEKLLECRLLKKDEVVSCGGSLTFSAYLIDILDAQEGHKPITDLNSQGRDMKITGKPSLMHRQKLRNRSVSSDRQNYEEKKNKAWQTLSPSRKIIREFKKSEVQKYQAPQTSPDTTKPSTTEWHALYTTQVTQKAKKYHDGCLQLVTRGSLGRQVMLFDESRKLLNSRFLKKDEVIRSGESIPFDSHLVEIGEHEEDRKPQIDLSAQGNNCNVVKETRTLHGKGALQNNSCSEKEGDSNFRIFTVDETKLSRRGPTNKPLRDAHQILSVLHKPTAQESIVAGYMDKSKMELAAPPKGTQVSDAVILDSPKDDRSLRASLQHRESGESVSTRKSSENIDIGNSPDLMSSEAISSELSKGVDPGNSHQPGLIKIEADTQWCDGAFAFADSSSTASPIDNVRKTSTEYACTGEIDEGPSFDLGF